LQEKNSHILIDGINKLPEHKAPDELWDNIETMILTVPADILPIHKPTDTTWNAIESGIDQGSFLRKITYRSIAIALLMLLLGGASIIYFNGDYFNSPKPAKKSNFGIVTTDEQKNTKKEEIIIVDKKIIDVDNSNNIIDEADVLSVVLQKEQIEYESILNTSNSATIWKVYKEATVTPLSPITKMSLTDQYKFSPLQNENNVTKRDPFQDCNFQRPEQNFYIGPGLEYQHTINSITPENTTIKYWYSADLRVMYQRNRFFIETGLGISFSKDKVGFTYDYLTNELVNTYEYVDSVYYDPITGTTEYFTTTVEVYDSIAYSQQSSTEISYTYLQIPLEVGYEVWKVNEFSLSIKAGITYFKELSAKEIQPNLFHENSRITSINTSSIIRNKDLFRVSGGVGLRWNLNRKMNLLLNPSFNYFLVDIYDNADNRDKPIGVGIRFGLYYKF